MVEATSDPSRGAGRIAAILEVAERRAPLIALGYVLCLAALRLSFSPFLEVDEAEFVGRVDLRLVYDNAHPPLFNWAMRGALELTDWRWALSAALVKYGCLALFHLAVWDSARRLAGPRAGLLALAASAFLPQVVWMSATTLAHSIMVMAGAALTVNAVIRALERPSLAAGAAIGAAACVGALAKFNFALFLIPFCAALWWSPEVRRRLGGRVALAGAIVFCLLIAPSYLAAALSLDESASRIVKLYRDAGPFSAIDPPYLGVDGFLATLVAALAWAGPALAIWAVARRAEQPDAPLSTLWRGETVAASDAGAAWRRAASIALARSALWGLALFAAMALLTDIHAVHERYLTPILAATPVALATLAPLSRARPAVIGLAALAYIAALIGFAAQVGFSKHRYAAPYAEIAAAIARDAGSPAPIRAAKHDDAANLILALGWTGARAPRYAPIDDAALLVWRGEGAPPGRIRPRGFAPVGPRVQARADYANLSGAEFVISFQRFARKP